LKNLLSEFEHIIVEKSARLSIPIRECEGSKATSVDNIVSKDNSKLNEKVAGNTKDSSNSEIVSDSVNDLNEMITSKPAKYDNSLKASSNNRISLHEFHEYSLKDGHEIIQDVIKGNKALKDKKLVEDIDIDTDTNSQSEAMRIEERIALDKNVEALDEILLHGDEIISSLNLNLQSDKSKSDTDKDKTNK
jgi:hypothetical protein